jgi:lipopolysaccharide export system ATP-binding protein
VTRTSASPLGARLKSWLGGPAAGDQPQTGDADFAPGLEGTLCVHNLGKSYGGRQVVKDVSLRVQRGEAVGLLGPNGAGKTTVFYLKRPRFSGG